MAQNEDRNIYRDTDQRMTNDAEFHGVVRFLIQAAEEYGFTPGELKQMAFRAALEVERRNPRPFPRVYQGSLPHPVDCDCCRVRGG